MHSHLYETLNEYAQKTRLRLHMPAHGGVLEPTDVTELASTDDLLCPMADGAILKDERAAADLFGSRLTLFSAGGATLCLQTAIAFCVARQKKGALTHCFRGVHRSVLYALALLDVQPCFFDSEEELYSKELSCCDLVILNGCDYFGNVPDYGRLSDRFRRCGVMSVVDNAHGTHLRFLSGGVLHPLNYGFDLIVDSAHKTLSCRTGAALLHVGSTLSGEAERLREELLSRMRLFSSTSPSFPILLSLTEALAQIASGFDGENYVPFVRRCELVGRVARAVGLEPCGVDPMRLSLVGGKVDYPRLAQLLQRDGIEVELSQIGAAVLLFGEDFTEEKAEILINALRRSLPLAVLQKSASFASCTKGECAMTLREALLAQAEVLPREAAAGRVAAEVLGLYPPGTALCLPGEVICEEVLTHLTQSHVRVVKEEVL